MAEHSAHGSQKGVRGMCCTWGRGWPSPGVSPYICLQSHSGCCAGAVVPGTSIVRGCPAQMLGVPVCCIVCYGSASSWGSVPGPCADPAHTEPMALLYSTRGEGGQGMGTLGTGTSGMGMPRVLPAPSSWAPPLLPGANPGLWPCDTAPLGLLGRCWHCSSLQALQTAQGKIFNSASHFNLKSETKMEKE